MKKRLKDCFVASLLAMTLALTAWEQGILTLALTTWQLGILTLFSSFAGCDNQDKKVTADDYGVLNPQRDFSLHDQEGKVFNLKDHRGEIVLLFFGYTSCPDICPTTLSKLARVYALLGPLRQKVLTVFVTIDPQRDTPDKLKEYLEYFNIHALGLSGSKQEIDAVVDRYKATYQKVMTNSSALGYMFDHTDYLYLIDAHGKTSHLFHPDDKAQDMAQIIKEVYGKT